MTNLDPIVIVAAARTPMGGFGGCFSSVSAPELGSVAIAQLVVNTGLSNDQIDEVIMGCVLPAGLGQAPARQAALKANLAKSTACTTINKVCGSGMKAVMMAHDFVLAGSAKVVIAGGMENMSQSPYLLPKSRSGYRMGHGEVKDHMFLDGLEDAYTARSMGTFAQETADSEGFTRQQMDEFAISSLNRANDAIGSGAFVDEIAQVTVTNRRGDIVVDTDEQPGNARIDKIGSLRPAFAKEGTITAANSSSISDGASALLIMRLSEATQRGLTPMAKIVAHATHAQQPSEFTVAPIGAMTALLAKASWSVADVDLFEINEAFAMVTMLGMKGLAIAHAKVNVIGGACALGHPLGSSGSRIIVTLLHALKARGLTKGIASLCIGGGEATASAVEML